MSAKALNAVWDHSRASGTTLLVLVKLADRSDDEGVSWPGVEWIARHCRMGVRNVQTRLRELTLLGELDIKYQSGPTGTNLYRVLLPGIGGVQDPAGAQDRDAKLHPRRKETKSLNRVHKPAPPKPRPCPHGKEPCDGVSKFCDRCWRERKAQSA